jgi:hypothetical protein
MEHKPLDQLRSIATIVDAPERLPRTRAERLARWAQILERDPTRRLKTLHEVEYAPRAERMETRADDSALAVAFADPVLRAAGLPSDKFGDAIGFFDLSEGEAHRLLCSCLNGRSIEAGHLAKRIRNLDQEARGAMFLACTVPLAVAAPVLMYLVR